jgi:hypothetical protein
MFTSGPIIVVGESNHGGFSAIPATKIFYVDGTRPDSYTANGSVVAPFKTIMAAVNRIATNGDNSTNIPYIIDIIGPGSYFETVDLSAPGLVNIIIEGHNAVIINSGNAPGINCVGNPGLLSLIVTGVTIAPTNGAALNLVDSFNIGTFLTTNLIFFDCILSGVSMVLTNCGSPEFYRCQLTSPLGASFTNLLTGSAAFFFSSWASGGTLTLVSSNMQHLGSLVSVALVIGVGCSYNAKGGVFTGAITINGVLSSRGCDLQGGIILNSGGTFNQRGTRAPNTLTNNGGTFLTAGYIEAAQVTLPNSQTILTGIGVPAVAAPVGSLYLRTDGGANTTLYVKETGTDASGWIPK